MRVLVIGGGGAVGRRLLPMLHEQGHDVVATSRRAAVGGELERSGARALVLDVLDAEATSAAVSEVRPDVIVHQATSIAGSPNLRDFDSSFAATNRLRTRGLDHLLAAARAVGTPRLLVQSFTGWPSRRDGVTLTTEADPLAETPLPKMAGTLAAVTHVERAVEQSAGLDVVGLRYGFFHGPGTSIASAEDAEMSALVRRRRLPIVGDGAGVWSFTHVDDAAGAVLATLEQGRGAFNFVDDHPAPVAAWLPALAAALDAPPPRHVPTWLARPLIGATGVAMMTDVPGASNARARRELGWVPRQPDWATVWGSTDVEEF